MDEPGEENDAWRALNAEQGSAKADQAASREDQTLADSDQTSSGVDARGADLDQDASDRDQAIADREHSAQPDLTADEKEVDYQISRLQRQSASVTRQDSRRLRSEAGLTRDENTTQRDRTAKARDETGASRDARAVDLLHRPKPTDPEGGFREKTSARVRDHLQAVGLDSIAVYELPHQEDAATYYVATELGLYVVEPAPGRSTTDDPLLVGKLIPWSSVRGCTWTTSEVAGAPGGQTLTVTIAEPPFNETAGPQGPDQERLADFALEVMKRQGQS